MQNQIIISTAQLCEVFGVSKETISQWVKKGMPKTAHGKYNLQEVLQWKGVTQNTEGMSDEARKNKAEADWKETKAIREKFQFDIEKGKYFSKEEVSEEWSRRIMELKNALLLLQEVISEKFTDAKIREIVYTEIQKSVHEMLEQYHRVGKYTPKKNK